jgi:CRP/FNR family transcriptional regulator
MLCLAGAVDGDALSELDQAIQHWKPTSPGQHIYRQGDALQSIFFVKTGAVKTYLVAEDGCEQIERFLMPGDMLGFDGLESGRHTESAIALDSTALCEVPFEQLKLNCVQEPKIMQRLLEEFSRLLTENVKLRLLTSQRPAGERLASFLVQIIDRMAARGLDTRSIHLPMSRYDIGNYLGIASETVSRLFTRFERMGLVEVERRDVQIRDIDRLRREAAPGLRETARSAVSV